MITHVKVVKDDDTLFKVEFDALAKVPNNLMETIMERHRIAKGEIDFPYQPMEERPEPTKRVPQKGKAAPAPAKRGALPAKRSDPCPCCRRPACKTPSRRPLRARPSRRCG
jgi:hypothetical protein